MGNISESVQLRAGVFYETANLVKFGGKITGDKLSLDGNYEKRFSDEDIKRLLRINDIEGITQSVSSECKISNTDARDVIYNMTDMVNRKVIKVTRDAIGTKMDQLLETVELNDKEI